MSANVQFTKKGETEADTLQQVDESVAKHFGGEAPEDHYYENWFDAVGLLLALDYRGHGVVEEIERCWKDYPNRAKQLIEIAEFLDETYNIESWRQVGRW